MNVGAQTPLRILHTRGGCFETEHPVAAVLVDALGRVQAQVGPDLVTTWRSAAKPFQLEASLSLLPADVVSTLSEEDLAIAAASHSGEPMHVARVQALLARFGATESDLRCGAHWPVHDESARNLARAGGVATAIHNNCSGKHALMVAASQHNGFASDYREPTHPLQARVRAVVDQRTGGGVETTVTDGCGVPCFVLSLSAMARAWASLAVAMRDDDGVLGRIGWSMQRHPLLMSGTGRLDLSLIQAATAPLVTKVGAEGLECMAIPQLGLGLALKVTSGAPDPRAVAIAAVVDRWVPGLFKTDAVKDWQTVTNIAGTVVGARVAEWADAGAGGVPRRNTNAPAA